MTDSIRKIANLSKTIVSTLQILNKTEIADGTPFSGEGHCFYVTIFEYSHVEIAKTGKPSLSVMLDQQLEPVKVSFKYCKTDKDIAWLVNELENRTIEVLGLKS